MASTSTEPRQLSTARMVQNFRLVWLDENLDNINRDDGRNSITQLRQVINAVDTFIDADECIDFIINNKEGKIFMMVSGALSQIVVPVIQDIPHVSSIYIFCGNKARHETWSKHCPKIQGVYTDITLICEALRQAVKDCDHNAVSLSFVKSAGGTSQENLDTLDQSFMYTQIMKEILLTIDFEQEHMNQFLMYCREQFVGNSGELKNIDKIEREYRHHQPIWWYTSDCFLYSMLNRALRLMEVDLIIKMGFFVRDLHNNIVALHAAQYSGQNHSHSFTVYRGQGLSETDFDHSKKAQGGLLSFNNFLSTSQNRDVSLKFAQRTMATSNLVGVLFVMKIDPSISATPFANVRNVSYYQGEEEILFSMHSVFRIDQVKQIDKKDRLWQIDLTLTGDHDPQLHALTVRMREETKGSTGWLRLGQLMLTLGQVVKAEELYEILLQQSTGEVEQAHLFCQLACAKDGQGKYPEAIGLYEQALEIFRRILPAHHPHLAASYNNIALVHQKIGEHSKALSCYKKALEILQKTLPTNYPHLATSYNNIGAMYVNTGEYSKALSYYEKTLEIFGKTLPANHPHLATSFNNIGQVYRNMGEYSKAFSYYEKALEIYEKTLPANHPDFATCYNNIGAMYVNMDEYSKALSYYEKALEIYEKTLPANHPDFATCYNNIGAIYVNMDEYSKALSYYEKALEIFGKTLSGNHPHLATCYNNIGAMYLNMDEYSKALSYYGKALEIFGKILPGNHPDFATCYNNIGGVYANMGEHSKALSYYERALNIQQHSLPPNHPHVQNVRDTIEMLKKKL